MRGHFYLQIIDNTGHTVDLVADSARDILARRVSKLRVIYIFRHWSEGWDS